MQIKEALNRARRRRRRRRSIIIINLYFLFSSSSFAHETLQLNNSIRYSKHAGGEEISWRKSKKRVWLKHRSMSNYCIFEQTTSLSCLCVLEALLYCTRVHSDGTKEKKKFLKHERLERSFSWINFPSHFSGLMSRQKSDSRRIEDGTSS